MARFLRYLRITFSATCLIACVLLIALWVRSYWWTDVAGSPVGRTYFGFRSDCGVIMAGVSEAYNSVWILHVAATEENEQETIDYGVLGFGYFDLGDGFSFLQIPYWSVVLLAAMLAVVPWLRYRFSLQTLLIATTLIAVVLGLIVWQVRQ